MPNTAAARKALERARRLKEGLKRVEVYVPEGCEQEIKDFAKELTEERETNGNNNCTS
jgi:hypothetical protein